MGEPIVSAAPPATAPDQHEESDVHPRPLLWFLAGLTASLVAVAVAVAWLFGTLLTGAERGDPPPPLVEADRPPSGPALQVSPRRDLQLLRQREKDDLEALQWIDRPAGTVRMPVERAMELAAEGRFPEWPAADPATLDPGSGDPASGNPATGAAAAGGAAAAPAAAPGEAGGAASAEGGAP